MLWKFFLYSQNENFLKIYMEGNKFPGCYIEFFQSSGQGRFSIREFLKNQKAHVGDYSQMIRE